MKETNKKEVKEQDLEKVSGGAIYGSRQGNGIVSPLQMVKDESGNIQSSQALLREEQINTNENK